MRSPKIQNPPKRPLKLRDWDYPIGPVEGKAGEIKYIELEPEEPFQGEKLFLTDEHGGHGTGIGVICIGNKIQGPVTPNTTLSVFYAENALGNGKKWDVCKPGQKIKIPVHFYKDSKFYGAVFGKTILDEEKAS